MKEAKILIFALLLINGSLYGQNEKNIFIDSDIKKQFFPGTDPERHLFNRPDFSIPKAFENRSVFDPDRFTLLKDSVIYKYKKADPDSGFVVVQGYSMPPVHHGYPFIIRPDLNGYLLIKKPDPNVKYYLYIMDPVTNTIRR